MGSDGDRPAGNMDQPKEGRPALATAGPTGNKAPGVIKQATEFLVQIKELLAASMGLVGAVFTSEPAKPFPYWGVKFWSCTAVATIALVWTFARWLLLCCGSISMPIPMPFSSTPRIPITLEADVTTSRPSSRNAWRNRSCSLMVNPEPERVP